MRIEEETMRKKLKRLRTQFMKAFWEHLLILGIALLVVINLIMEKRR